MMEVRGLGLDRVSSLPFSEVSVVAYCIASGEGDRLPEPRSEVILGVELPIMSITALEPSAPAKMCRAWEVLGRNRRGDYDVASQAAAAKRTDVRIVPLGDAA